MAVRPILCPLPFNHLFINNRGFVLPCCLIYPQYVATTSGESRAGNVLQGGIQAAIDSELMHFYREQFKSEKWPNGCETCRVTETSGNKSRRQEECEASNNEVSTEVVIKTMDLRLGNVCNLACRMCSPFSSQALLNEWRDAPNAMMKRSVDIFDALGWDNWSDNEELWSELEKFSSHLRSVNFAGGEPLLNRPHVHFLESLIRRGRAEKIKLSYNTNLTFLPEWLEKITREFESVHLIVSVDGFEGVNEYIRYPSKWSVFTDNLQKLAELKKQVGEKLIISFNATVQIYNLFGLDNLLHFVDELGKVGLPRHVTANFLHNPDYFDAANLPKNLKNAALDRIRSAAESIGHAGAREFYSAVEKHLSREGRVEKLVEFYEVSSFYDKSRGQDLFVVVPELRLK